MYLAYDPPWLKTVGDLATTGIGLAAAIRIWQVFPFDLPGGWSAAVRTVLVVAIAGSCLALVVQIVALTRWLTGPSPHGGGSSPRPDGQPGRRSLRGRPVRGSSGGRAPVAWAVSDSSGGG